MYEIVVASMLLYCKYLRNDQEVHRIVGSFGRRTHVQTRTVRHKSLDQVFQEPAKRCHSIQAVIATHCNKVQQRLLDVKSEDAHMFSNASYVAVY